MNFGPLTAEIGSGVWGTPTISTSFASWQRYCTASSSGRQPNIAALNRGRYLCSAGRPSGWALAHILVQYITRNATYSYGSKFSFLQRTFTIQLPTDSHATCRIGINNVPAFNAGRSLWFQMSREWSYPLPIYWYHSKGKWLRYNFAADSFYIMKLCSRLFVLYWRNCLKDGEFRYLIPILRKLGAE